MNVLIVGLGKTGAKLIEYFNNNGDTVHLYSDNDKDYLDTNYIRYNDDTEYQLVVKCPGVPYSHTLIKKMMDEGVEVIDEVELSYRNIKGDIIGITGTNGKSTTTKLIFDILANHRDRVFLAGNIGIPLVSYVKDSKDGDIYVTELSSFQLENIDEFKCKSAVITNLTPDHLSRHGNMEEYFVAKKMILKNLDNDSIVVLNADDKKLVSAISDSHYNIKYFSVEKQVDGAYLKEGCFYLDNQKLIKQDETNIVGIHNAMNALAAIIIAKSEGVPEDVIIKTLKEFNALKHRYEVIGEKHGIRFINDSKSTNPESSMPAINSVNKPTILIMGGMEKGSDFNELVRKIDKKVEFSFIFGECKNRIAQCFVEIGNDNYKICSDLDEAFQLALAMAKPGYDIVLSPACASWDMYDNFEKRGEHFRRLYGGA